jgi:nitroimidazol reductase NimA-like FMN-containing flavoprotein (pyridoxamine 5'-phosphate oxidase superfamily)
MLIKDLNKQECSELLKRLGFGRLGCASKNQPYVVPIYFAYEPDHLFAFSTAGQKIEWMRTNPLVCVQADEIVSEENWTSVLVTGRYEELPDNPQYEALRLHAHALLEKRTRWWRIAIATSQTRDEDMQPVPILYCIHIEKITGLRRIRRSIRMAVPTRPIITRFGGIDGCRATYSGGKPKHQGVKDRLDFIPLG